MLLKMNGYIFILAITVLCFLFEDTVAHVLCSNCTTSLSFQRRAPSLLGRLRQRRRLLIGGDDENSDGQIGVEIKNTDTDESRPSIRAVLRNSAKRVVKKVRNEYIRPTATAARIMIRTGVNPVSNVRKRVSSVRKKSRTYIRDRIHSYRNIKAEVSTPVKTKYVHSPPAIVSVSEGKTHGEVVFKGVHHEEDTKEKTHVPSVSVSVGSVNKIQPVSSYVPAVSIKQVETRYEPKIPVQISVKGEEHIQTPIAPHPVSVIYENSKSEELPSKQIATKKHTLIVPEVLKAPVSNKVALSFTHSSDHGKSELGADSHEKQRHISSHISYGSPDVGIKKEEIIINNINGGHLKSPEIRHSGENYQGHIKIDVNKAREKPTVGRVQYPTIGLTSVSNEVKVPALTVPENYKYNDKSKNDLPINIQVRSDIGITGRKSIKSPWPVIHAKEKQYTVRTHSAQRNTHVNKLITKDVGLVYKLKTGVLGRVPDYKITVGKGSSAVTQGSNGNHVLSLNSSPLTSISNLRKKTSSILGGISSLIKPDDQTSIKISNAKFLPPEISESGSIKSSDLNLNLKYDSGTNVNKLSPLNFLKGKNYLPTYEIVQERKKEKSSQKKISRPDVLTFQVSGHRDLKIPGHEKSISLSSDEKLCPCRRRYS